jgi:hypothetical protein
MDEDQDREQPNPAEPRHPASERRDTDDPDLRGKLGRERPGEGLDTGFDTADIAPGKSGGANFQD